TFIGAMRPVASRAQTCGTDYTIREGETLAQIAARVYGNPAQWTIIFYANQDRLGTIFADTRVHAAHPMRRRRAAGPAVAAHFHNAGEDTDPKGGVHHHLTAGAARRFSARRWLCTLHRPLA